MKKNVLFLARRYSPHIGGVETHVEKISHYLLHDGYEVTVVTERDNSQEKLQETVGQVKVLRIPLPNEQTTKNAIWSWMWRNRKLLMEADIIHIHDVFFWILPLYPFLRMRGVKIFITFHGYEGSRAPNFKQKFWHQVAALLSHGSIGIGGFHHAWYGVLPTFTSFGAVESGKDNMSAHTRTTHKMKRILFVGRLSQDVGIIDYISGLSQLDNDLPVVLDVFGNGPQEAMARAYAQKTHTRIHFYGFVSHEKIRWETYDVAFVSRYLAILECFDMGIPVIAHYDAEIKRDYLVESPFKDWIVAVRTPTEVAQAIRKVLSPEWSLNIARARDWARQQTWKRMAQTYQTLWERY